MEATGAFWAAGGWAGSWAGIGAGTCAGRTGAGGLRPAAGTCGAGPWWGRGGRGWPGTATCGAKADRTLAWEAGGAPPGGAPPGGAPGGGAPGGGAPGGGPWAAGGRTVAGRSSHSRYSRMARMMALTTAAQAEIISDAELGIFSFSV